MGIRITGVHHIMVTVGDLDVARDFYGAIMDFAETDCPVKDGLRVWYRLGNQELHVNYHEHFRSGFGHFAIALEPGKYHAYYEQVKSSGYDKVTESHKHVDGLYRFYVDDPFGNTVEVTDGQITI